MASRSSAMRASRSPWLSSCWAIHWRLASWRASACCALSSLCAALTASACSVFQRSSARLRLVAVSSSMRSRSLSHSLRAANSVRSASTFQRSRAASISNLAFSRHLASAALSCFSYSTASSSFARSLASSIRLCHSASRLASSSLWWRCSFCSSSARASSRTVFHFVSISSSLVDCSFIHCVRASATRRSTSAAIAFNRSAASPSSPSPRPKLASARVSARTSSRRFSVSRSQELRASWRA